MDAPDLGNILWGLQREAMTKLCDLDVKRKHQMYEDVRIGN